MHVASLPDRGVDEHCRAGTFFPVRGLGEADNQPMVTEIIVGCDGSEPSFEALRWAVHEARRCHAAVRIVSCYPTPGDDGREAPRLATEKVSTHKDGAVAVVDKAIEYASSIDSTLVLEGVALAASPVVGLTSSAVAGDEIVVGASGHSGLIGGLLGSVAAGVTHRSHVPVVVVPAKSVVDFGDSMQRIVVGVDGSPESLVALDWAYNAAALSGADLDVVHGWIYPYPVSEASPREVRKPMEFDAQHELEVSLDSLGRRLTDGPVVVRSRLCEQSAVDALLTASDGADLVVVGSRGRGAFRASLLGSVSRTLVQHATCPVAVVRQAQR